MPSASAACDSASSDRLARIAEACERFGFDYDAAPKEWAANCNLCGMPFVDTIATNDRSGFAVSLAPCRLCGLFQLSPRMTADAYRDFYERGVYRALGTAQAGKPHDNDLVRRIQTKYAKMINDNCATWLRPRRGGTLLDIGGSVGLLAKLVADEYDLRATVLDPAPAELDDVPEGVDREQGLVESWDSDGRKFDVILMTQTVDHLLDIRGTLERVRDMLSPGGVFFVDSVDWPEISRRGKSVQAAIKIDHVYSLTAHTMNAYLLRAGFAIPYAFQFAGGSKTAFVCQAGERKPALPTMQSVWEVGEIFMGEYRATLRT